MTGTVTRFINAASMVARGTDEAAIVIQLMMACNDIGMANEAQDDWSGQLSHEKRDRQIAARLYFIRIQIGHVYECLRVVEQIQNNSSLRSHLSRCDPKTQASFAWLEDYLPRGSKQKRFEELAGRIRSNLAFHYHSSNKLIVRALADHAERSPPKSYSVTRASTAHRWRFTLADDITDQLSYGRFGKSLTKIPDLPRTQSPVNSTISYFEFRIFLESLSGLSAVASLGCALDRRARRCHAR